MEYGTVIKYVNGTRGMEYGTMMSSCRKGIIIIGMEYGTETTYVLVCTCCPHIEIRVQE